jgi:glyoxylase-like metal-dependent hydrolase (beta-lactamase superfamily II)
MPAEVKILVEGCTNFGSIAEADEEKTQPTITLVQDGNLVMVVDPGILESQQVLVDALKKENLTVKDVNVICITHSHFDHFRNVGMFPKAKTLEYGGLWHKNTVEPWLENFTPNIKVLHTPGHDYTCITLFVTTGSESQHPGVVAICGDVFWKKNYPENPQDDAFASNVERLKESREMILKMADWIIPGHGQIYKNDKNAVPVKKEDKKEKAKDANLVLITCKRCGKQMMQKDKCQCRPWLCFECCECGLDCDNCSCSHKNRS